MPVSPICLVADGLGPFVPTAGGVNVLLGDTISIKLTDTTGVVEWYLQVTGTDELSTAPTLTNVNPSTNLVTTPGSIVTFPYPSAKGRAVLFQSTVTGPGGPVVTTFTVYSLTDLSQRVGAAGETREGNTNSGWSTIVNPIIRSGASVLYYNDAAQAPASGSNTIQGVLDWLKTIGGGSFTAGGDLSGTPTSQTVTGLQTRPLSNAAPGAGTYIGWSGTQWEPLTPFTAGGDLGGTTTSQTVLRINGTTITTAGGALIPGYVLMVTGVATADWQVAPWITGVTVQSSGTPIAGNPHTIFNFTGAGVTTTDVGGVATVTIPGGGGGGGPVGDNADAVRMGPDRPFLMDGQFVSLGVLIRNTLLNSIGASYAGADLVVSENRLLFTGRQGITQGQLYSIDLAGHQMGLDYSLSTSIATITNPYALIGVGVETGYFNTLAVGNAGAVSNYIYESIHSTPTDVNIVWPAGAEDWSGARACYVYTTQRNATYGNSVEVFFTAPLADKVYQGNIYNDTGDPFAYTFTGETPTGICAAGDNTIWVSFVGSGKLRQYQVNTPGGTYPTITQVGADVTLANVIELLFDGKYLWALSTTGGSTGTIYKLSADGTLQDSFAFTSGVVSTRSRMCFDGSSVWITRGTVVNRIFPEGKIAVQMEMLVGGLGTEARGIVCDPHDKTIYVAVGVSDTLNIYAWVPPTGELWRVRERQATWRTNVNSMPSAFTAIDITSQTIPCSRQFEFTIGASQISGGTAKAAWKKYVAVDDDGTNMTIIGSVADIVPPMLNAGAITDSFDVTVTSTGTRLQVTIDQGTLAGGLGVNWTINVKETRSFAGAL